MVGRLQIAEAHEISARTPPPFPQLFVGLASEMPKVSKSNQFFPQFKIEGKLEKNSQSSLNRRFIFSVFKFEFTHLLLFVCANCAILFEYVVQICGENGTLFCSVGKTRPVCNALLTYYILTNQYASFAQKLITYVIFLYCTLHDSRVFVFVISILPLTFLFVIMLSLYILHT